jgi:hypothetical protein
VPRAGAAPQRNADYLRMLDALDPALRDSALVRERGGTAPFAQACTAPARWSTTASCTCAAPASWCAGARRPGADAAHATTAAPRGRPRAPGSARALARRRLLPGLDRPVRVAARDAAGEARGWA